MSNNNHLTSNLLILRFSAMGDVVLTVPVIKNIVETYSNVNLIVVSQPFFKPFFNNIKRVTFVEVDVKKDYKGLKGLFKLKSDIVRKYKIDLVIDLHSVMRTWVLDTLFRLDKIKVFMINKERQSKKKFIKQKQNSPLKHTVQRYIDAFNQAGFKTDFKPQYLKENCIKENKTIIGIAPFAAHKSKTWGIDKINALIQKINSKYDVRFLLFGGGKSEIKILNNIASQYNNVENIAGTKNLDEEISLISTLNVFIAMDSGNMHIATLTGIPVISIWGGTHPDIGFSALYQPKENSIQIPQERLSCRPCSVYGTSQCHLKNEPYICMKSLNEDLVIKRLEEINIF